MPGKYTKQTSMLPLSDVGLLIGTAIDTLTPEMDEAFPLNPEAFPQDARGLLDTALLAMHATLPHAPGPPERLYFPMVITTYHLVVLAAQIQDYVAKLPENIQTRFRAAVDQELVNRREYYQGLEGE